MPIFRSFRSTVAPFLSRTPWATLRYLVDPVTGAPTGVESPNANGPDGIWTPIDITVSQLAVPSALMIADINATYRLNEAPYGRYRSDGAVLVSVAGESIQGPNGLFGTMIVYSPFTVTDPAGIAIRGTVSVRNLPA